MLLQRCTINELIKKLVITLTFEKVAAKLSKWQKGNGASNVAA